MPNTQHGPQLAVGAVVFQKQSVLLIRRGKAPNQGLWSLPGGRVNLGENLEDAVKREVAEETGILVNPIKLVYHVDLIERDQNKQIRYHYVVLDYLADYLSGEIRAASDADAAAWVQLDQLETLNCVAGIVDLLKRVSIREHGSSSNY